MIQTAVPLVSLYLPTTHATHDPPNDPVYPTVYGQRLVPATELEFDGQIRQTDEFRQFLYVPTVQGPQGPPSGPVNPDSQKQMVSPGIETEFCGHEEHVLLDKVCTAVEYMFVAHA